MVSQKRGTIWGRSRRRPRADVGLDAQGRIMASCVSDGHEQGASQVPELLSQIDQEIESFIADGIYDQAPVYAAVERHSPGVQVIIPPRKDAAMSPTAATSLTQRDQRIAAIEYNGAFHWRRTSGYYGQSHAENAFSRFKCTFGGGL